MNVLDWVLLMRVNKLTTVNRFRPKQIELIIAPVSLPCPDNVFSLIFIQDKERRIYELKHKNQELEKFKFILDFKIKELKSQIEPRDSTIREQTEQINDMVNELENLQKIVLNLDLQLVELREKLRAADNELKREVAKNTAAKAALKTIRTDLHHASGLVQDIPKLTRAFKVCFRVKNKKLWK